MFRYRPGKRKLLILLNRDTLTVTPSFIFILSNPRVYQVILGGNVLSDPKPISNQFCTGNRRSNTWLQRISLD